MIIGWKACGYIAQWLERLTADQQVPGSNPGVPFSLARQTSKYTLLVAELLRTRAFLENRQIPMTQRLSTTTLGSRTHYLPESLKVGSASLNAGFEFQSAHPCAD